MQAVHLIAADGIGALTPADELFELELGDRVDWYDVNWQLGQAYSSPQARIQAAVLYMVGCVSERTSHRGLPFPPEWWPPSAGPYDEQETTWH